MIKVWLGNNNERTNVIVDESRTLRSVLEENNIDYARTSLHLDGASLAPGDINKTFASFNVGEQCYLLGVVKADGNCRL